MENEEFIITIGKLIIIFGISAFYLWFASQVIKKPKKEVKEERS